MDYEELTAQFANHVPAPEPVSRPCMAPTIHSFPPMDEDRDARHRPG